MVLPPVLFGLAHFQALPHPDVSWRAAVFMPMLLFCGAMGEEIAFRGALFAALDAAYGPAEAVAHGGEGHYGPAAGAGPGGSVLGDGDQLDPDYHHHIDADGDGKWDQYVAVRHGDGGVDVYEDRNHDGLVDFIGHDRNADGILESADYDENFDGVADTHMADTNGDGWMDTRGPEPTGA